MVFFSLQRPWQYYFTLACICCFNTLSSVLLSKRIFKGEERRGRSDSFAGLALLCEEPKARSPQSSLDFSLRPALLHPADPTIPIVPDLALRNKGVFGTNLYCGFLRSHRLCVGGNSRSNGEGSARGVPGRGGGGGNLLARPPLAGTLPVPQSKYPS